MNKCLICFLSFLVWKRNHLGCKLSIKTEDLRNIWVPNNLSFE